MADGFMDNSKGCVQKLWIKWNDVEENLSRACLEKNRALNITPTCEDTTQVESVLQTGLFFKPSLCLPPYQGF